MNHLKNYYAVQSAKGYSNWKTTLLLPLKLVNQLRLKLHQVQKPKDMIYGFDLFHLPLLASYSRSGTNWVRYIIESISDRPTPGQTRLRTGTNYLIDRAHCAYPILKNYKKVILVLRDYKECLLRHHQEDWLQISKVQPFLTNKKMRHPPHWYIQNIKAFHNFKGEKLLIYYEDLLADPQAVIAQIAEFLNLDRNRTSDFLSNIDHHYQHSVALYTAGGHKSETAASKDTRYHSQHLLTAKQEQEFDDFYLRKFPKLTSIYLRRYHYRFRKAILDHS